jgi:hypothetical protein
MLHKPKTKFIPLQKLAHVCRPPLAITKKYALTVSEQSATITDFFISEQLRQSGIGSCTTLKERHRPVIVIASKELVSNQKALPKNSA